jgi:hypothetical protein
VDSERTGCGHSGDVVADFDSSGDEIVDEVVEFCEAIVFFFWEIEEEWLGWVWELAWGVRAWRNFWHFRLVG